MKRLTLLSALSLFAVSCAHTTGAGSIEQWNANHPAAAQGLCAWVREHPEAAHEFFEWDSEHPERSHEFVTWSIGHPGEGIEAFVVTHPRWGRFDNIAEHHRPAANAFMQWARTYPEAAERLMDHERGLHWAGNHLGC